MTAADSLAVVSSRLDTLESFATSTHPKDKAQVPARVQNVRDALADAARELAAIQAAVALLLANFAPDLAELPARVETLEADQ